MFRLMDRRREEGGRDHRLDALTDQEQGRRGDDDERDDHATTPRASNRMRGTRTERRDVGRGQPCAVPGGARAHGVAELGTHDQSLVTDGAATRNLVDRHAVENLRQQSIHRLAITVRSADRAQPAVVDPHGCPPITSGIQGARQITRADRAGIYVALSISARVNTTLA
jgi:hypothetical protein